MLKTLLIWTALGVTGSAIAAPNLVRHADLDLATARQLADAALTQCTGALTVLDRGDFPSATVWSQFGAGYGYVPLVLPVFCLGLP